jgi:predicted sulfurtransferase
MKTRFWWRTLFLVLVLPAAAPVYAASGAVPLMTTEELKALIDNPDVIILDVRQGKDWSSSEFKIKGAVYADPGDYKNWTGVYPKEKKIVLYCA